MTATLENTSGYTQADLDRFNAHVEAVIRDELGDDPDHEVAVEIEKRESDRYLTDDAASWPF